ncbi:TIGR04086 family membrane protein [Paenibacillus septentrionalis]|uniref:TIGR04086 family membrane protein n=1 Tax=Paenibacillus septentrionalis TaxID=429342 RepID=A0ABW1UYK2_9BACL
MNTSTRRLMAMPLMAGITFALIWLAIGALLLSLLLHFTSMKESNLGMMAFIVHSFASFVGGFSAGKRAESKGWYYGSSLGVFYGLIIIIVSFLATDVSLSLHSFILLLTVLAAGAFGGMIGVNLRK